ncbi:hypothetical protein WCD41_11445 [Actinomycetospora sp. OC33-EN06]|uniref:Uncharacterized protein n=1 Tax=Actinomycetospora aeridis TaxID=3129231 RepID=A0ABU8N3U8_9PSEU
MLDSGVRLAAASLPVGVPVLVGLVVAVLRRRTLPAVSTPAIVGLAVQLVVVLISTFLVAATSFDAFGLAPETLLPLSSVLGLLVILLQIVSWTLLLVALFRRLPGAPAAREDRTPTGRHALLDDRGHQVVADAGTTLLPAGAGAATPTAGFRPGPGTGPRPVVGPPGPPSGPPSGPPPGPPPGAPPFGPPPGPPAEARPAGARPAVPSTGPSTAGSPLPSVPLPVVGGQPSPVEPDVEPEDEPADTETLAYPGATEPAEVVADGTDAEPVEDEAVDDTDDELEADEPDDTDVADDADVAAAEDEDLEATGEPEQPAQPDLPDEPVASGADDQQGEGEGDEESASEDDRFPGYLQQARTGAPAAAGPDATTTEYPGYLEGLGGEPPGEDVDEEPAADAADAAEPAPDGGTTRDSGHPWFDPDGVAARNAAARAGSTDPR